MFIFGRLINVRFFLVEDREKKICNRSLLFNARDIGTLIRFLFLIEEKKEIFDRCLFFNARDIGTLI